MSDFLSLMLTAMSWYVNQHLIMALNSGLAPEHLNSLSEQLVLAKLAETTCDQQTRGTVGRPGLYVEEIRSIFPSFLFEFGERHLNIIFPRKAHLCTQKRREGWAEAPCSLPLRRSYHPPASCASLSPSPTPAAAFWSKPQLL